MQNGSCDIGLIGLAVMGQNLVLNMNDHGYKVAVFNRTVSKVDDFINNEAKGTQVVGTHSMAELAQSLALSPPAAPQTLDQLTSRDLEILRMLGRGASLSEVAEALGLGYKTVANNCTQIKAKLGVRRTADLVRIALESGVI